MSDQARVSGITMSFLIGVTAGVFGGLVGLGGGVVMITAMVLPTGLDQHTAQETSLLAMVPAGAVGT